MPLSLNTYERTIVFVQRMNPQGVESFCKFVEMEQLLKRKIVEYSDFENVEFGEDQSPMQKSISFPSKNIKIVGLIDRLIISMLDTLETDTFFHQISKKFSDALVKENISAIGVNFNGIMETKKASEVIKNKILDKSPKIISNADSASFRLVYNDTDKKAQSIISIDNGAVSSEGSRKEGIIVSYNYHRDIKTQQLMKAKMDEFQESLEQVKVNFEAYKKELEDFLNAG